ncbi:GntR family transcriptional regulator [Leucobacter sp. NPDC058333]|uniref:GntR family transcriptional regulator n=1 Tax=Leucobacter sp. NPDC058333 TaxID=3346450 RepID=UPI0036655364
MSEQQFDFAPLERESTPVLIARTLRDAIARGRFKPGQQLLETDLSQRFGVSRGLLREAMQRLTQEGLLVGRKNRGIFVATFGPEDLVDIYTSRIAIERGACLKVIDVTGRTEEMYAALTALTDELEALDPTEAESWAAIDLDIAFHEKLVEEAQSPRLNRMYETLAAETRMCLAALEGPSFPLPERIAEHRRIADAIRAKDVPTLHALLAQHMDHALAEITRLRSEQPDEPGVAEGR